MHTIIPAPTTVYRIKEMTPTESQFWAETAQAFKNVCAFIAFIIFVCSVIVLCIMIKTS
ncbi:hypothetical protein EVB77_012 [Rhizobium phage RHph_N1_10]|nr:hypothetical protein EVB77_012 [Rhizobium phage RHph_N1_10]